MLRLIRLLVAFTCILLGALIGALNPQLVMLDLGFAALPVSLGLCVLLALLLGVLLGGGLLAMGLVMPLRHRLRRAQAKLQMQSPNPPPPNTET